jgi:hypothetical protein
MNSPAKGGLDRRCDYTCDDRITNATRSLRAGLYRRRVSDVRTRSRPGARAGKETRLKHMPRFPLTFAAVVVTVVVLAAALVGDINLIELPFGFMSRIELHEMDDIVTAVALVIVAFVVDAVLAARLARTDRGLEGERLRVVQVTMRTVQDIVNNGLNQLQLLRFDAEGHVPPESLALFDEAIRDTVTRLTALGDLQAYAEKQMAVGPGLTGPFVP